MAMYRETRDPEKGPTGQAALGEQPREIWLSAGLFLNIHGLSPWGFVEIVTEDLKREPKFLSDLNVTVDVTLLALIC